MEPIWDKLHEECGVLGIYDAGDIEDIISDTYYGLYALQHRGQESCGVAVNDDGVIQLHKDVGLVSEVFARDVLERLPRGKMTVGHCRYATTGTRNAANAQPLVVRHVKGSMALAHNGNLTNAARLRRDYELQGAIFHSTSDTEVIAYTITRQRLRTPSIQEAVVAAMSELQGAYSLVIMSPRKLIAARDPMGFRPLCMGRLGESVVFASESCALDAIGAHFVRDIDPGEVVVVSDGGSVESIRTHCQGAKRSFCVFEYIYFARPDSVIDGSAVHTARQRAGALLALSHPAQADVVVGVPDSGLDAALGYAQQSGIPYGIGFLKNKYIGRTFIAAQPEAAGERRADQAEPHRCHRPGQAGGAGGRLHRPGNHQPEDRPAAAGSGGRRGSHAPVCASLPLSLLLRHGYRLQRKPHRLQTLGGGDRGDDRRGFSGLPAGGGPAQAPGGGLHRTVRCLLYRRLSRGAAPARGQEPIRDQVFRKYRRLRRRVWRRVFLRATRPPEWTSLRAIRLLS